MSQRTPLVFLCPHHINHRKENPMAVLLQITYSKKLGLPNYSSHSCSVSVQVEIADVTQVAEENARLYQLLQSSVDKEIQAVGFIPDATKYGMNGGQPANGNGRQRNESSGISEKQLDLINKIVNENNANKAEVEQMAVDMFGGGVRTLNRMQASNFIDELFAKYPRKNGNGQRGNYQRQPARSS
jgi:hypothetical protein